MVTRREVLASTAAAASLAGPVRAKPAQAGSPRVAVIGAGVFGAWSAWHLVRRGCKVLLVDAYGAGHARASSGGESRVIRLSYGGDPLYSGMARESLAEWAELSRRQSQPLLYRTGVLWFSPAGDGYMAKSLAWLQQHNIACETGNREWLQRRYPQIAFRDGESGFIESDSGGLIAGRGVRAVVADAGLAALRHRAALPERLRNGRYRIAGEEVDALIYACGPWLPALFPELLGGRIAATRQEVYHFGAPPGDSRFAPPAMPVWADFNAGDIVYGLPDLEGQGFKLAFDAHGARVDPDTHDRRISAEGVTAARAYLATRFPALAEAPLIHSRVCQYENSSNGDFLLDRMPGHERVWLVGAGSGHGFKHGPAVGRRVAERVLDAALAIEPRFSLASKDTVAARAVF